MKRVHALLFLLLMAYPSLAFSAATSGRDLCKNHMDHYKEKLRKDPDDDETWSQFRACVNELKRWNDGMMVASDALEQHPDIWQAHLVLGISQLHTKEYEKATTHFDRATALKPDHAAPFYYLGMAYLFQSRSSDAALAAAKAVQLEPDNASYHSQLAYTLLLTDERERCEAEAKKAIELDVNNIAAYKVLGNLYQKEGKQEESDHAFEEAIHANGRLSGAAVRPVAALPGMSAAPAAPIPGAAIPSVAKENRRKADEEPADEKTPGLAAAQCRDQWNSMKDSIAHRDNEAALSYFSDYAGTRDQYRLAFQKLGQDRVREMFANMGDVYDCQVVLGATTCKAAVSSNREGVVKSSEVTVRFERNPDRKWRIRSF